MENNDLKENLIKNYNADSIQQYDMVTGIRKKTEVYLASKGLKGSENAITEIILNSLDEYGAFPYTELFIKYNTKTKIFENKDTGRGIYIPKIRTILENLHVGAKLDQSSENSGYKKSKGSYGMGSKICVAVSDFFEIEVNREGKTAIIKYENGYFKSENITDLKDINYPHGTKIKFRLSEEVFDDTNISPEFLHQICETMSYTSPGFSIHLTIDGKTTHYISKNGLIDLIEKQIKLKQVKPIINPIKFILDNKENESNLDVDGEVIFTFENTMGEKIISFVNKFTCPNHGTHLTGIRSAITMAMNKYMEINNKISKKYEKMNVSGSIINDFLVLIVSIDLTNPRYADQTKMKLDTQEIIPWIKSKFYNLFLNWLNNNTKEADKLVKLILLETEAAYMAKQAKNKILGIDKKENFISSAVSKRLEDCLSKNPEECELFIVEGESASVGSGVNSNNQAYYLLRGKIPNVYSSNKIDNDVLLDFINMLGIGFGEKKNLSKLRYHKIILLADADEDGQHITALLLAFFYKYYPELIINGYIYIGNPPLYSITVKKSSKDGKESKIFIQSVDHYNLILVNIILDRFKAYSNKSNKEIPKEIFKLFLYGLIEYETLMNNLASQQNINPILLEYIVIHYKDIQDNKFDKFDELGYKVSIKEASETHKILTFDEDIHHYNVNFNKKFYELIYYPIFTKIAKDIKLHSIYLKEIETNKIYKGSLYEYSRMMNSIFIGKISPKIKGLGEMDPEHLEQSVLNPKTRNITQVKLEDAKKATKIIETFLGKNYMDDKKAYFETNMKNRLEKELI